MDIMNHLCRYGLPGGMDAVKTKTGICHQLHLKTQISRHACGRVHTMIGANPAYHQSVIPRSAQIRLQCRADKGGIDGFTINRLSRLRGGECLEGMAVLAGEKGRARRG